VIAGQLKLRDSTWHRRRRDQGPGGGRADARAAPAASAPPPASARSAFRAPRNPDRAGDELPAKA
jgi:hypothetical protein